MKTKQKLLNRKMNTWEELFQGQMAGISIILALMVISLSIFTKTFFTSINIFNILRAFSWIAICAFGECMVIITGGIDLSVGSVMAFSGLLSSMLMVQNIPILFSILAGVSAGAVIGLVNGLMITRGKLPPFIATLGTLLVGRGLCYGLTGGWPVRHLPLSFTVLGQYDIPVLGIPLPLIFVLLFAGAISIFLNKTVWGYRIYAIGGNIKTASLTGINTDYVKILVYTLAGILAAIGGILMTSRLGVAAPTAAQNYELDVIAATVVGGASLSGGEGKILGILTGAAIMQVLRTGLVLTGVSASWLPAIQGVVIVTAIMIDQARKKRKIVFN